MSSLLFFPGGSGSYLNANSAYEPLGFSTGGGTVATAGSANVKGSASATLGTTAAAWWGFTLYLHSASSSTARYLVDISINGGSTWLGQNFYANPGAVAAMSMVRYDIPLIVAASSDIRIRCQSSSGSATIAGSVVGWVSSATTPPGFANMVALNPDTAATHAGTPDVTIGSGWAELEDSSTQTFGAWFAAVGISPTANPLVAQSVFVELGTGAAAAEAAFLTFGANSQTSGVFCPRGVSHTEYRSIASTTRVSARLNGASGTDPFRVGAYGFY